MPNLKVLVERSSWWTLLLFRADWSHRLVLFLDFLKCKTRREPSDWIDLDLDTWTPWTPFCLERGGEKLSCQRHSFKKVRQADSRFRVLEWTLESTGECFSNGVNEGESELERDWQWIWNQRYTVQRSLQLEIAIWVSNQPILDWALKHLYDQHWHCQAIKSTSRKCYQT